MPRSPHPGGKTRQRTGDDLVAQRQAMLVRLRAGLGDQPAHRALAALLDGVTVESPSLPRGFGPIIAEVLEISPTRISNMWAGRRRFSPKTEGPPPTLQ